MTQAKHTPAPWRIINKGSGVISGDELVASVYPCEDEDKEAMLANSHLIAAAPELLEACQLMLTSWKELGKLVAAHKALAENNIVEMVAATDKARAAIAKAKGSVE